MGPGRRGGDPAPRRPGQQTFPYQEGFRDLLDRLALLPHGHCEGGQAHRAAAEELQQRAEHRPVQPVQAPGVDLVHPECRGGDGAVDPAVRLDLGVVADAAEQPVGDTGRTAGAAGDLGGAVGVYRDVEEAGRAVDDAFQFGGGVELHVAGEAEAVAQRGGRSPARVVAPTRVKGGSSSGMAVAPGPLPTMTSTRKSSIAM